MDFMQEQKFLRICDNLVEWEVHVIFDKARGLLCGVEVCRVPSGFPEMGR